MELLNSLFPISSRTLVGRLRDMEKDRLVERTDFGGNPPHIEYALTERGMLLLPLLESLRQLGLALNCNDCEDRKTTAWSLLRALSAQRQRFHRACYTCPPRKRRFNHLAVNLGYKRLHANAPT